VHRLTTNTIREQNLAWSPDGRRIVFDEEPIGSEGPWSIWIVNADGSNPRQLTTTFGVQLDSDPRWSPDGRRVAYIRYNPSGAPGGSSELHVVNADGSGDVRLLSVYEPFHPSWSPDGRRLAFTVLHASEEIYAINADGSGLTNLTRTPALDEEGGNWSPDGSRISFIGYPPGAGRQLYTVGADGTNMVRLTNTDSHEDDESWSPDGQKLAFRSSRDRQTLDLREIYVMNADGSGQTRLTTMRWFPYNIAWSSDGARLAFIAELENPASTGLEDRWEPPAVYVLNVDGTGLQRLAEVHLYSNLAWKP
jgi:Tol biopolymer transport system component